MLIVSDPAPIRYVMSKPTLKQRKQLKIQAEVAKADEKQLVHMVTKVPRMLHTTGEIAQDHKSRTHLASVEYRRRTGKTLKVPKKVPTYNERYGQHLRTNLRAVVDTINSVRSMYALSLQSITEIRDKQTVAIKDQQKDREYLFVAGQPVVNINGYGLNAAQKMLQTDVKFDGVSELAKINATFADQKLRLDATLDNELTAIRNVLTAGGQNNSYKVELSVSQLFASTVTTGVVNGVANVSATGIADFTALAGLFEEYKIESGRYRFMQGAVGASASTTPSNTGNLMCVLGYSLSNTAYTSVGTSSDDHFVKLYSMMTIDSSSRAFIQGPKSPGTLEFAFKVPSGIVTGAGVAGEAEWLPTSDSTTPFGYMKAFWIAGTATATANALNGVMFTRFHFRNRI